MTENIAYPMLSIQPFKAHLKVRKLSAGYHGKPAVHNVNIDLRGGEFVGLVGHNGSGKSTVLLGITGLIWAMAESIKLMNREIAGSPPHFRASQGLGILLQKEGLFPDLTIKVNLELAGVPNVYPSFFPQDGELAEKLHDIMERRAQCAGSLSSGERRLLSLVLILARRPTILLADEPTLGLSESLEVAVMEFLRDYASAKNQAVLVVSHNLQLVEKLCSRLYVIERGMIRSDWRPDCKGQSLLQYMKGSA